ncbi:hypothetical protein [Fodinibius sp.]|uniref:hypothetical protein n=1 Tax=Fodinibius sp. TaxID=1872440 RepID=UPI002ACD234B|nr:hypothetical protein [Fodinibius sp.]MDZ7658096.1 hypothetical protein [Fodinibius sp.]
MEAPSGDIGGFQVGGSVIESFGDGQSFVKMISGTRPEFRFQAQNGELLHIGGDYSFDQEDDTAYGGSGIAEFNALVSVIGENNDTTTETRSSTQNINASDIGKSLDYVATYDVNLDENGTASASAKITITIQFRDSNNTVLSSASNSDTRTSDGFGFTTGTSGQVPTNTDHVNVIVELQADATSFDKDGSAQAEITFKSDDINAIGVNEFISPLGFSFVNEGSTASRKPRILGDRDIGQLLCHEFVVENQDGDQFTLKVTTGSNPQLKIYDENGGEVQAFG